MQSAAYYELNKPTKEWTLNSHLLDTDYDNDDDAYMVRNVMIQII